MASIEIFRYKHGALFELDDQVGVESHIQIPLENGFQLTLACTEIHVEELALGLHFSQGIKKECLKNRASSYDPISYEKILHMFKEFSTASPLFRATGSVHSGQLIDENYQVLFFTEDMGRHNVIDKIIGFGLKNNRSFKNTLLMISSRMPLELIEKAYRAGIQNIACVSAPTREAVSFARSNHINLVGMYRENRFNVYSK